MKSCLILVLCILFLVSGCQTNQNLEVELNTTDNVEIINCDDKDACTLDTYDKENKTCSNLPISPCQGNDICEEGEYDSNDCPSCDDKDACTLDTYDFSSQSCNNEKIESCCGDLICTSDETKISCPADCDVTKNVFVKDFEDPVQITFSPNYKEEVYIDQRNNIFWIQTDYDKNYDITKNLYVYNIDTKKQKLVWMDVDYVPITGSTDDFFRIISSDKHTVLQTAKAILKDNPGDGFWAYADVEYTYYFVDQNFQLKKIGSFINTRCEYIHGDKLLCSEFTDIDFDCLSIASAQSCTKAIKSTKTENVLTLDIFTKVKSYIYKAPEKSVEVGDFFTWRFLDMYNGNYLNIKCHDIKDFSLLYRGYVPAGVSDPLYGTELNNYANGQYSGQYNPLKAFCGVYDFNKNELIRTENPGKYFAPDNAVPQLYLLNRYRLERKANSNGYYYQLLDILNESTKKVYSYKEAEIFRNSRMQYNGEYFVVLDELDSKEYDLPTNLPKNNLYFIKSNIEDKLEYLDSENIIKESNLQIDSENEEVLSETSEEIKVANWNLQIFGDSKAENPDLMKIYSDYIKTKDIVFIQEIRDIDGSAFSDLCDLLSEYSCISSSRAGRSTSKEQYGVIYKKALDLDSFLDFNPDTEDRWERPPFKVTFNLNGHNFDIYTIHTKPSDAPKEIENLNALIPDTGNVIILGDLNADCDYYDVDSEDDFEGWYWIIEDEEDTTVSATDCAYDRIILNEDAYQKYRSDSIELLYINKSVSDHYPVSITLDI